MIDLVFKNYTSQKVLVEKFFRKVLKAAVKELKLKKKTELSINLVGEVKIKELNKKYRNQNKIADVLSFPLQVRLMGSILSLGDIFICLPFAKKKAKEDNIDIKGKLAQLTVHGFLHLLGYDHEKSVEEASKMERLEELILNRLNL